ncbi:MAG TPA: tetratricopeptide repeat protein, partial [Gemmatimonadota bacterium]|nr:tetratricopeptide repeat protein [Gemmatimonadota bacterium]
RFQAIVRAVVQTHGGRVVKFLGDGALAEFPSTEQAVRSADALRADFARVAEAEGLGARELRIGVHVGDVATTEDGDLYGDGVNVASRITAAADPGEVWVSEDVRRQLRQRPELRFATRGEHALKGLRTPLALHAVGIGEAAATTARERARPKRARVPSPRRRALALMGVGALVAIVLIGGAQFLGRGGSDVAEASIAVLPFENLSDDAENEYFSDGITDDILTALSKVGDIRVISRTSTLQYKGTTKPIREIASELDVATVLEGTVRRAGNQVRITAQLIDADTDEHLWAETYDRELTDVFAIQSEIAARIADELHVALSARETASIRAGETSSPEAYDLVLQARERLQSTGIGEQVPRTHSAIRLLRQALELDPGYARAHAALGDAYSWLVYADDRSWADSALAASERAIDLAPDLAAGHIALGWTQDALGQVEESLATFRRAIELDPNNAEARDGAASELGRLGRLDELLEVLLPAVRRDPDDLGRYRWIAEVYETLGQPELAEAWAVEYERRSSDDSYGHVLRYSLALARGDAAGMEAEVRKAAALAPGRNDVRQAAILVAVNAGRYDEARRLFEAHNRERAFEYQMIIIPAFVEWETGNRAAADSLFREGERRSREMIDQAPAENESYVDMARIASVRGQVDEAIAWMEEAYAHGRRDVGLLRIDPPLANARRDPRFQRLLEQMDADLARMRERAPKERP